jgi:hypothetical protein
MNYESRWKFRFSCLSPVRYVFLDTGVRFVVSL